MQTEYDDNILDYWKLPNGNFVVKTRKDDSIDGATDIKILSHLRAFIFSNSKRKKNFFIRQSNGFYNNSNYYGDTDSIYIVKKYWDVLDKAVLVGDNLCHGKNDYKSGGSFHGLFPAPKVKHCLTFNEFSIIGEYETFEGFNDSNRLLDRSHFFKNVRR